MTAFLNLLSLMGISAVRNEPHSGEKLIENLRRTTCIQCGSTNLKLFFAIEQDVRPPFEYEHTIIAVCVDCKRGQLERTYCDSADQAEILDQAEWFLLDGDSVDRLRLFIQQSNSADTVERRFSPCPEPLSPKCLCGVHWQLAEAAKRLEPLSHEEMRKLGGVVVSMFSLNDAGLPGFEVLR